MPTTIRRRPRAVAARAALSAIVALALAAAVSPPADARPPDTDGTRLGDRAGLQDPGIAGGPYERLVIRGAMVIPGHGGPAYGPADIVVEGDTIAEIVALDPVTAERSGGRDRPDGDRVLDATGMYVMPGMIDLHTHIRSDPLPLDYVYYMKLAHGVTTVANGSDRGWERGISEARRAEAHEIVAPRMYPLHGWGPIRGGSSADVPEEAWRDPEQAPELARRLIADGAHVISVGGLGWNAELFGAVCRAVAEAGGITTVHLPPSSNAVVQSVRAAELGVTMIEHHYGYAESALERTVQDFPDDYNYNDELARFRHAGKVWQEAPRDRLLGEVVDRLVESGVSMIPTMAVYEANRDITRAMSLPWHGPFTHRLLIEWSFPNPRFHGSYHWDWTSDDEATWAYVYRTWQELIAEFNNRGGRVGYATDDNYIWAVGGISNVRELQLMQETGMHPLEIVRSATRNSALILRRPDLGLVQTGYRADLAIVDGNPLHNFRFLYAFGALTLEDGEMVRRGGVRWTIRDGVVYDVPPMIDEVVRIVDESKENWTDPVKALYEPVSE